MDYEHEIDKLPAPEYPVNWLLGMLLCIFNIVTYTFLIIVGEMGFLAVCMIVFSAFICLGAFIMFKEHLEIYNLSKEDMRTAKIEAFWLKKSIEETKRKNKERKNNHRATYFGTAEDDYNESEEDYVESIIAMQMFASSREEAIFMTGDDTFYMGDDF